MDQKFEAYASNSEPLIKKDHGDSSLKSIIIHVGTNHLPRDNPVDMANKIWRLMIHTSKEFPNTLIYFSAILPKFNRSFNSMINCVNNEVFSLCLDNQKSEFIQHSNFEVNHDLLQSRYAVVWNACFHHQDHLDFVKHLINVYLLKKVYINS